MTAPPDAADLPAPGDTASVDADAAAPGEGIREVSVMPRDADPAATENLDRQFAARPAGASRGQLLVMLAGAYSNPSSARGVLAEAARLGFHALSPDYSNGYDIGVCGRADADATCFASARLEAFDGQDRTPLVDVKPPDAIETRLVMALRYLQTTDPGGGWADHLDGDRPRWPSVVIAGHSHGASTAALIGKVRPVARVVMMSGPWDQRGNGPAAWMSAPGLTPSERYFGASHQQDGQHAGHLRSWAALGLNAFGPPLVVRPMLPFVVPGTHQLIYAGDLGDVHHSTRPPSQGTYAMIPAFRFLLTAQ